MTDKHELCRPADLVCEDRAVARQMTENLAQTGCPEDIEEAAVQASEDVVAQREEALAKQLEEQRRKKARLVDPLQYEMSIQAEDLAGYVPAFGWEAGPPTEQQAAALEKLGILPDAVESAGKASLLLDRLNKRRAEGLTTPKQIRVLERYGFRRGHMELRCSQTHDRPHCGRRLARRAQGREPKDLHSCTGAAHIRH